MPERFRLGMPASWTGSSSSTDDERRAYLQAVVERLCGPLASAVNTPYDEVKYLWRVLTIENKCKLLREHIHPELKHCVSFLWGELEHAHNGAIVAHTNGFEMLRATGSGCLDVSPWREWPVYGRC